MASAVNPTLLDQFLTFINPPTPANQCVDGKVGVPLFAPTEWILLAVSGGLDSVVMAHLFRQAGFLFAIAHVNFGLRGSESDGDALFVENLARQYAVPFHTTQVDTATVSTDTGVSIQMAARTLRYTWFEQVRAANNYTAIATAHHRNDVLETLLLNLTRGTGLAGLHGIAVRQGHLIRPLLFADRADLETYAKEQQLDWREDRSNASDYYARNRIRHQVVPVLQRINPNLLQTLTGTIERLRAAEALVQYELDRTASGVLKNVKGVTQIDLISLRILAEPIFRLAEWLRPFGYTYQQTTAIWLAIEQRSGQEFRSATHRLIHEQERLTLVPILATDTSKIEPVLLTELPESGVAISNTHQLLFNCFAKTPDFLPPTDPNVASVDADVLAMPIVIRRWQTGDRFRPFGLNGQKLVSDLLSDLKVSRLEREQTHVLVSGDRIAWVIGRRLDHHFRITAKTQQIIQIKQIEILPPNQR